LSGLNLVAKPSFSIWRTRSKSPILGMAPNLDQPINAEVSGNSEVSGLIFYDTSLFDIVILSAQAISPKSEALVLTSRHGLLGLESLTKTPRIKVFCVGEATAHCARMYGFTDLVIGQSNGLALMQKLKQSLSSGAYVTIRRGSIAAHPYAETLTSYGFDVEDQCVYETRPSQDQIAPPMGGFQSVWVYSRQGAEALLRHDLGHLLHENAHFIAISQDVALVLTQGLASLKNHSGANWRVHSAKFPNEAAILTLQTSLLP